MWWMWLELSRAAIDATAVLALVAGALVLGAVLHDRPSSPSPSPAPRPAQAPVAPAPASAATRRRPRKGEGLYRALLGLLRVVVFLFGVSNATEIVALLARAGAMDRE